MNNVLIQNVTQLTVEGFIFICKNREREREKKKGINIKYDGYKYHSVKKRKEKKRN